MLCKDYVCLKAYSHFQETLRLEQNMLDVSATVHWVEEEWPVLSHLHVSHNSLSKATYEILDLLAEAIYST